LEDACGEAEVKRVKLSEGGRRDILMKEDLNSGLYQVKGGHRNDATFYKDWEQLEDLEAKRPMTKEDFFRCKPLPSHRSCGREQQSFHFAYWDTEE
jgi:hypothetical protein